jgi:glycerol-3-phosphate dehydrogenase (NAD(P)+)
MILPPKLKITASLAKAVEPCHLLFVVVPAQSMRRNIGLVRPHLQPETVIVSAAKGLEIKTALRMSQLLEEELGSGFPLYALSGPNLVREIAAW